MRCFLLFLIFFFNVAFGEPTLNVYPVVRRMTVSAIGAEDAKLLDCKPLFCLDNDLPCVRLTRVYLDFLFLNNPIWEDVI